MTKMAPAFAHPLIAHLCVEMAHEAYEMTAKGNNFYRLYPNERVYVDQVAPTLREQARHILGEMLARNDVSEREKKEIYEALLLDKSLPNNHIWEVPHGTLIH